MNRWSPRSVGLLSALAALATSAFAQAQGIRVVDVPLLAGSPVQFHRLPGPSTPFTAQMMVQDDYGFLWFGTADGLQRYDGYGLMRVPEGQGPSTVGFTIAKSLARDRAGRLWIGADDSLNRYDPASGEFKQYRSPNEACGTVAVAHDIKEDQDGVIWLATDDGLTALDPVTSKATCHRPRYTASIGETRVIATLPVHDGTLWITSSDGLYVLDRRSGKIARHLQLKTPSGRKIVFMGFPAKPFQDSTGTLWIGLSSGGDLASFDLAGGEITVYSFADSAMGPNASSGVVSIQEDHDRTLWLGTDKLGLVQLAPDRRQAIWHQANPDDTQGLGGDLVTGLFRDRTGSLWSMTKTGAVHRFSSERPAFRSYRHQRGNPQSLGEGAVTAAYADDADALWIGTNRGLNRVDRRTGVVTRQDQPVLGRGVNAIAKDHLGNLWLGTNGNGLVRFDPRSGVVETHAHDASDPRSLNHDRVAALRVDRAGTLWIATDFGLNRWDPATQKFWRHSPQPKSLVQYRSIAEEANGVLWLATSSHGVHRFDPRTSTFTIFDAELRAAHGPGHNRVNSIHVDREGTVWAATFRGLDKFNPRDGTFKSYDSRSGLPTDTVLGILEEEGGRLWISTLDGLSRFDPRAETFMNYHASDGLLTDSFGVPVVATASSDGEMFFGSQKGLVAFFPDQVVERKFAVPVFLTGLRLFGEPVSPGKAPLKEPIWSAASLELESRSIVSFDFAALNYLDPSRTRYRHRLEGLESKWNETDGARRTATYTTLPTGSYTFLVQARAPRGDWNESAVTLRISVPPPWYATWSFRTLVAALLLTALWLAHQLRLRHLHRRFEIALDARVNERTRIARDLHDTLLQSFHGLLLRFQTALELLPGRPAEARSMLASTIDQAADALTEGRDAVHALRTSVIDSNSLAVSIRSFGNELQAHRGAGAAVALRVEVHGATRPLHPIVRDEAFRIAGEALRNALRHAVAGQIEVELLYERQQFRMRVRDDGKGIDRQVLEQHGRSGHFGLEGMRERAAVVGGRLTVWSALDAGTEIELTVPAANAYVARDRDRDEAAGAVPQESTRAS